MVKKQKYYKLFEPIQINGINLKNRIVRSAQACSFVEYGGFVNERVKAWHESLAEGGAGLITVEEVAIDYPLGVHIPHIRVDDDKFIPGLSELAEVVHKHNCPIFVQLQHDGPAHLQSVSGLQPVAPSSLDPPVDATYAIARALFVSEIKELVEKYAQAALRIKKAGFDGVEMHMAHYGLINAFLSRIQNKRQDEYGCQNLENRARFAIDILQRVRELVGSEFVIGARMVAKEWGHKLGTTPEEAARFAKMFEKAGADYLQVSAWGYGPFNSCAMPDLIVYPEPDESVRPFVDRFPTGVLIPETEIVRKAVSIPISGVGLLDYKIGERLLEEGRIDMACFARSLIADPEWPNKLGMGREKDIRPCLHCAECLDIISQSQPLQCRVNAFAGNETEMAIQPADKKKKIMIVGAGPAGMEAARVAMERGHEVTLYDKAPELGGLLLLATFVKGTGSGVEDLTQLLDYFKDQLKKLGVKVQLGKEVDKSLVNKLKPDVVILAVGGEAIEPELPVNGSAQVVSTEQLKKHAHRFVRMVGPRRLSELTKVFLPVGEKVIVIGSDLAGLETAEFLAKRGKEVVVVDEAEKMGEGMLMLMRMPKLIPWMQSRNISILNGVKYQEVTSKGITVTTREGNRTTIKADTVMVVNKHNKNTGLYQDLKDMVPELYLIGDAKSDQRGYIRGAINDGARVALEV